MRIITQQTTIITPHEFGERNIETASRNAYMSHAKSGCSAAACKIPGMELLDVDGRCSNTRCEHHTGYALLSLLNSRSHGAMFEFAPMVFTMRMDASGALADAVSTGMFTSVKLEPIESRGELLVSGNFRSIKALSDFVFGATAEMGLYRAMYATAPKLCMIMGMNPDELTEGNYITSYNPYAPVEFSQKPDEHQYLSVNFITNRGITHELVRHRPASFAQRSTRYVDEGANGMEFVVPYGTPEGLKEELLGEWTFEEAIDFAKDGAKHKGERRACSTWLLSCASTEQTYNAFRTEAQWPAQKARGVLTNDLRADITMMSTVSHWKFLLGLRTAKDAHPQVREITQVVADHLGV